MQLEYLKHLSQNDDFGAILHDLMVNYGQEVWNYAFILTKNKETADDIRQEVFLKAYQHMHNFRGESSVKTWLLRITRNLSLNVLKSTFFRKVTLVDRIFSQGARASAEAEMLDRMTTKDIWHIVLKLPLKYREILILEAHYGYSEQEMAELLAIAQGTVKSRLYRARSKVEKALKEVDVE